jgi:hypothetical protein
MDRPIDPCSAWIKNDPIPSDPEACMNEAGVKKLGAGPLASGLDEIAALKSPGDLPRLLARLHLGIGGDHMLVIAFASSGGLGLPDRDYYLKTDAKSLPDGSKQAAFRRRASRPRQTEHALDQLDFVNKE